MTSIFQPIAYTPPEPTSPHVHELKHRGKLYFQNETPIQTTSQSNQFSPPFLNGHVNSTTYATVLKSCSCPRRAKQVHAHLLKNGFHVREFLGTELLKMYGKCGCIDDAAQVFDKMPERNLYSYTAILNVLLESGYFEEAAMKLLELLFEDIELEFFVFPVALKICGGYGGVELGRQLHGMVTKSGVLSHIYVGNALIDMYGKCGCLDYAKKVLSNMLDKDCASWNSIITACIKNGMLSESLVFLDTMSVENNLTPNSVSWSALLGGFTQNGYDEEAIQMLYRMKGVGFDPNARTLASVLPACARLKRLSLGKEIYGYITRHGFMSSPYVVNGLVDLYRRCGDMESALKIFSKFSVRDEVSYNTMIAGYCDNGDVLKAKELFDQMESEGKRRDLISWNSMISGYANNFMFEEALEVFNDLITTGGIEPDSFTLGSALGLCANMGSLSMGKGMHSYCIVKGLQLNLFVGGSLVEMYSRCYNPEAAHKALHDVPERDAAIWNSLVSGYARCNRTENIRCILQKMEVDGFHPDVYTWNGIIAGYVDNDYHESALELFLEMQASNLRPDIYTVGIVLRSCSRLAITQKGKQVHAYAVRMGYESDAYIGAALIDMYAKCGCIKHAKLVHNRIRNYNLVTQNAMLTAYAMHGQGGDGVSFFREMLVDGFTPDSVTFLGVLSSCVHAGLVETGKQFFDMMEYYGVKPTLKHYTCMVDLLSRAGKMNEAYRMIEEMPGEPDSVIWGALLGGCIIHGNDKLGEIAAHKLINLEPENSGNYVMLANLYACTRRWHDLAKLRCQMKDRQLYKSPGFSWIEDKDEIHAFMACDRSHNRATQIHEILDNLTGQMRLEENKHEIQFCV